jgi:hypothetical protein
MSFPKFPKFHKLTIEDKDTYLPYYSLLNEPCCDFCFDDMMMWLDFNDDLEVSDLNGNLVIRFTNTLDNDTLYYSLLGEFELQSTLDELFGYMKVHTQVSKLTYIPEQVGEAIQALRHPNFVVSEDTKNNDYVYNVRHLLNLEGKPYENLRRRINHFKRENDDIQVREFDLNSAEDHEVINSHIEKWASDEQTSHNDPDRLEVKIISKHLQLAKYLSVRAYGLYANGVLVNINVFNLPPHKGWVIFNHIKCDYTYGDVYGYSFYSLFLIAESLGIKYVNFEQDLDIEGLRRIKTFFRPEKLLRRYTVSLASGVKNQ